MTDPNDVTVIKEDLPKIYDEAFTVKQQRWGTYTSHDLEGNGLITALTEEACISGTRWYLKGRQEGFDESGSRAYEGTVGGKL